MECIPPSRLDFYPTSEGRRESNEKRREGINLLILPKVCRRGGGGGGTTSCDQTASIGDENTEGRKHNDANGDLDQDEYEGEDDGQEGK